VVEIFDELRYNKGVWLPQRDSILGKSLCKHEDFFHKLKRVTSSIRTQQATVGKKGGVQTRPLLDKEKLLAIARKDASAHTLIIAALTGIGSDAMDPFAQSRMFVSNKFFEDVQKEDPDLALILRTIGEWYEAFDKTGLSGAERERRMSNMHDLFRAMIGPYWYCHKKPPSSIAGMPLRLWFALVANCDSVRVLVNVKLDRKSHASAGQPDEAVLSPAPAHANSPFKKPRLAAETGPRQAEDDVKEGASFTTLRGEKITPQGNFTPHGEHFELIRRLKNALIKYRYIGTYDLEGGFSALVMMVGFKPAIRIALGVLRKVEALSRIRAMPLRGFFFYRSKRARYDHVALRSARGSNLVNEWFGLMGFVKQSKRDQAREITLRKDVVLHARAYAMRANKRARAESD
jgi:hypothetical protein